MPRKVQGKFSIFGAYGYGYVSSTFREISMGYDLFL
jgi:hypothetical protein